MENSIRMFQSMNDIVFEGRNKAYGAYHLRQIYERHMTRAIMTTIILVLLAVNIPRVAAWIKSYFPDTAEQFDVSVVTLSDPPTAYKVKPPAPQPPAPKPRPSGNKPQFIPPVVVNEDEPTDDTEVETPTDQIFNGSSGPDTTLAGDEGIDSPYDGNNPAPVIDVPVENEVPFTYVEQMPEFQGGIEALYKYINGKMKYPRTASENGISGTVVVQFVVSREGEIHNTRIVRSVGGGCDEEALRVISQMPRWKPGMHNGRTVPVTFTLPIKFTLE